MTSKVPHPHPLPAPPGQRSYNQNARPRVKSTFSFRSNHSHKSSTGSGTKIDLHETHEEKQAKRLHTKADPSMALNEAEPSVVANGVKSSLQSLRGIQHLDIHGNPIADPDRSNPTRSRWERPLDTIRSFEAAIDGKYSRNSYMRPESMVGGDAQYNRRSSYYAGSQMNGDERPRYPYNNGYGGRSQSYRPESYVDGRPNGMTRPDSYYNSDNYHGPSNGYSPNRARYPRTASEPYLNNHGYGVYPVAGQQQSYETVTTASGNVSSPEGYSTDPSSENSSLDRIAEPPKEPVETYGFNGFGNTPQVSLPNPSEQYRSNAAERQGNGYPDKAPPLPRKEVPSKVPVKLGPTSGNAGRPEARPAPEKRKSWFGKRFSKNF